MSNNLDVQDDINYDPVSELKINMEQLNMLIERGEISASSVHADFYRPVKLDGVTYRTHAIMVDVIME